MDSANVKIFSAVEESFGKNNQHIDTNISGIGHRRLNSSFTQDQASAEDQFLWPIIFPTNIPSWSTRYVWGIQPLTPYWSIVFSFKSKRTGRVILFWLMTFWAALFLSPSIVIRRIVNGSLFPWKNFSRANSSSLQDGHQVAQKVIRTGFPLKSLSETCFPSNPLSEKAGASFFSWNLWMPKESQDGRSGWEEEPAWRQGMNIIVIPIMIESERTILFFISTSKWKSWQRTKTYSNTFFMCFHWFYSMCQGLNYWRLEPFPTKIED